jgi:hypothetical protein
MKPGFVHVYPWLSFEWVRFIAYNFGDEIDKATDKAEQFRP